MASSDEEIAESTEELLDIQAKEKAAMLDSRSATVALLEQREALISKLTGFGVSVAETVDEFKETMNEIMSNIEHYLDIVSGLANSDTPTWLAPYCMLQYGREPTSPADLRYTGPIPDDGLVIFGGSITLPYTYNSGSQFPSSDTMMGGPEDNIPMSIMVRKATLTEEQAEDLIPIYPRTDAITSDEARTRVFGSSLGSWAIHYPWNGIVTALTVDVSGNFTSVLTQSKYTNSPSLDFGKISEQQITGIPIEISGIGWGGGFGTRHDQVTVKDQYIDRVFPQVLTIDLHDRVTGITYPDIAVIGRPFLSGQGTEDITFDIVLPSGYFGRDISDDGLGAFAFLVKGAYDTTFGFTSWLSWKCFEKNQDGSWKDTVTPINVGVLGRSTGYEGSGLFFNSVAVHDIDNDTIDNDHARDKLYNININEDTLKDRPLYKANQLQGIYSGQIRDLAAGAQSWIKQWQANEAAIASLLEKELIYRGEASFNAKNVPVKPIERYLSLVRSDYNGISMQVPVDSLHQGEAKDGIKMTLVTGAMYRTDKGITE